MAERKSMSKKLRFEVFKRDSFTCQYCGRSAPDVILHVDHIHPVSEGGTNDTINLITSCFDCNSGKSNRELSDDAVIKKRKAQLDELQSRREQIVMMVEWNKELASLDELSTKAAVEYWNEMIAPSFSLNDNGIAGIKELVSKYGIKEVLECMRICQRQYLYDQSGKITLETIAHAFNYIAKVAKVRRTSKDNPYIGDLYYIRGILRNRFYDVDYDAMKLLKKAYSVGASIDTLKQIAIEENSYSDWLDQMAAIVAVYTVLNEEATNAKIP